MKNIEREFKKHPQPMYSCPNGASMHIFAHRGASASFPENSLQAVAAAYKFGADGYEIDIQATKDNIAIVLHDMTLQRTHNPDTPWMPQVPETEKTNELLQYLLNTPVDQLFFADTQKINIGTSDTPEAPPKLSELVGHFLCINKHTTNETQTTATIAKAKSAVHHATDGSIENTTKAAIDSTTDRGTTHFFGLHELKSENPATVPKLVKAYHQAILEASEKNTLPLTDLKNHFSLISFDREVLQYHRTNSPFELKLFWIRALLPDSTRPPEDQPYLYAPENIEAAKALDAHFDLQCCDESEAIIPGLIQQGFTVGVWVSQHDGHQWALKMAKLQCDFFTSNLPSSILLEKNK